MVDFAASTEGPIKVIIATDVSEHAEALSVLIQQSYVPLQVLATVETRQCVQTARDLSPHLVLLVDEQSATPAADICREIYQNLPGTATIILAKPAKQETVDYFRQALLTGARDVLPLPPLLDTLVTSIQQTHQLEQGRRLRRVGPAARTAGGGRMIAVYSPKGGTGCSLLAANLGVWLARQSEGSRVALVDLDLQFGDQMALLDLYPTHSIADLISVVDELSPDILESTVVTHPSGLRVLMAPPDPRRAQLISADSVRKMLIALRAYYDLVIVDTNSTLSPIVLTALEFADLVLQICTPDVLSIRRTRIALQLYDEWGIVRDKVRLVVNRTQQRSQIKTSEIRPLFEHEIIGEIPDDFLFLQPFVNGGIPFVDTRQQKSPILPSFRKLAEQMLAAPQPGAVG
jgi:pilus assembly protein CpaE